MLWGPSRRIGSISRRHTDARPPTTQATAGKEILFEVLGRKLSRAQARIDGVSSESDQNHHVDGMQGHGSFYPYGMVD